MNAAGSAPIHSYRDKPVSKHRLDALSDGIFAVVMTLLVLEIRLENLPTIATNKELWQGLAHLSGGLVSYVISFLLVGSMWIDHHHVFDGLEVLNQRLALLMMLFLLSVSLMPFTISLMMAHPQTPLAQIVWLVNFAVMAALLGLTHWRAQLAGPTAERHRPEFAVRIWSMTAAFLAAAVVTWFSVRWATYLLVVVLAGLTYLTRRSRRTVATPLRVTPDQPS